MDLAEERISILEESLAARRREVMHYQINIDNFRAAIALIQAEHMDSEDLRSFANELIHLLATTEAQQAREKISLRVLEEQLGIAHVG